MQDQSKPRRLDLERWIEAVLFAGRWIMAPVYIGLLVVLAAVAVKFLEAIATTLPGLISMPEHDLVKFVLSLIDLALLGNLVLMIIYVGYENFVSKLHTGDHEDHPIWLEHLDFSGLKIKLLGSIVAISAIHLLGTFLDIAEVDKQDVMWQLAIHLGFVVSAVLLALMDRLGADTAK